MNKKVKASIWYLIGKIINKGISFFTVPIFSRILTVGEFGAYNNFVSWLSIISIIGSLSVEATVVRAKYDYSLHFEDYTFSISLIPIVNSFAFLIITLIFNDFFMDLLTMDFKYILILIGSVAIGPITSVYSARQIVDYNYKSNVLLVVFTALLHFALSFIFIIVMKDNLMGRIFGQELATILVGVFCFIILLHNGHVFKYEYWKYALFISIPYVPHLISINLLNSMDRVMITKFCGETDTASYSMAYTCALVIRVITGALNNVFSPWLGEKLYDKSFNRINKISKIYTLSCGFVFLGLMLISPELLLIMGGNRYLTALDVIIPVEVGCFCQFIYTLYVNVEQFEKKTGLMSCATGCAAVFNYITNIILIPKYGYIAAAYTTLASYFLLTLLHFLILRHIKLHKVYNNGFLFMSILIAFFWGIGCNWLYKVAILRFSFLFIYLFLGGIIIYRNLDLIKLKLVKNGNG